MLPLYKRALSADPEDFETNFNIGILYYEHKDLEKAVNHLKMAVAEEPNTTALFNLGVIFEEQGNRSEAIKAY
jgi:tetratricopeptide (TPR) repeat protein